MLEKINMWIIAASALLIIYTAVVKKDKNLVTVIWILWTFVWIILWLLNFDTTNIEWSIQWLLNWLKTAFITSIFWLVASLVLWFLEKNSNDVQKTDTDFLIEIRDELKKLNNLSQNKSDNLIIEELKKLNKSNNELQNSFSSFVKQMSENNSKALIEAISQVMQDFNSKINNQLGQSFADLSKSVENLVVWQENYKNNIEVSQDIFEKSSKSLEVSSKAFEEIVENSKTFDNISASLSNELKNLNKSLEILQSWWNEFREVSMVIKDMASTLIRSVEWLSKSFVWKAEMILNENEKQAVNLKNSFNQLSTNLVQIHSDILLNLKEEIENNSKFTNNQFLKMQKRLEQQVIDLDRTLAEELEKSLHSLWQQLTGLSEKFVYDYGKLAEKLEKLNSLLQK